MPSIEVKNPDLFNPEDSPGDVFEEFCVGEFTAGVFSAGVVLSVAVDGNFLLGKDG